MIRTLGAPANLGTCIDTAHIFTAGYDLRTADDLERTLETFDREVGLDKLGAVHLNDSKAPFGSNKDRHENIGDGEIGAEALGRFIRHPALGETPLYLEVPGYTRKARTARTWSASSSWPAARSRSRQPSLHDAHRQEPIMLKLGNITFDCENPARVAEFWGAALGYNVEKHSEEFAVATNPDGSRPY